MIPFLLRLFFNGSMDQWINHRALSILFDVVSDIYILARRKLSLPHESQLAMTRDCILQPVHIVSIRSI